MSGSGKDPGKAPYPTQQGSAMAARGAPPAYSSAAPPGHQVYQQPAYYPGTVPPPGPVAYGQNPYGQPMYAQQAYPVAPGMAMYPQAPPSGQAVMMPGVFDAGARFDGGAQPIVPPPPPGCPPNAAQMAAMQGHQVVGSQRKSDFWMSGSGGGVSFW